MTSQTKTKTQVSTKTKVIAVAVGFGFAAAAAGGYASLNKREQVSGYQLAQLSSTYLPGYVPGYVPGYQPGYGVPGYIQGYGEFRELSEDQFRQILKRFPKKMRQLFK